MDVWTSESNPHKQTAASVACAVVGLVLMIGFRDFGHVATNTIAGFLLGLLLLLIGVAGFLVSGRQTVVVDPKARRITIEDANRFRTKKRSIPFSDITGISIGYLGKRSTYVTRYYLILTLRNGQNYSLFAPGQFYEGSSDRSVVMGWKKRLEDYLGSP